MKKMTILWITTCLISILAVILVSACSTVTKTTQTSTSTMTSANTTPTTTATTTVTTAPAATITTTASGNTTGTVENEPVASGAANQYNFNLTITSTTAAGITTGQQLLVAASKTDFPNLLTVGTILTGNLDNSLGWWVLKAVGTPANTTQLLLDSPLTAQQVHTLLQSNPSVVMIDTRATEEYTGAVAAGASVGHIHGAYSIPDDGNAAGQLYRFPDKTLPYICYCDTAACAHAGNIATIMILAGYTNVTYMSDGIAGWTAQGYSLVTGG